MGQGNSIASLVRGALLTCGSCLASQAVLAVSSLVMELVVMSGAAAIWLRISSSLLSVPTVTSLICASLRAAPDAVPAAAAAGGVTCGAAAAAPPVQGGPPSKEGPSCLASHARLASSSPSGCVRFCTSFSTGADSSPTVIAGAPAREGATCTRVAVRRVPTDIKFHAAAVGRSRSIVARATRSLVWQRVTPMRAWVVNGLAEEMRPLVHPSKWLTRESRAGGYQPKIRRPANLAGAWSPQPVGIPARGLPACLPAAGRACPAHARTCVRARTTHAGVHLRQRLAPPKAARRGEARLPRKTR